MLDVVHFLNKYPIKALIQIGYTKSEIEDYMLNLRAQIIADYLHPFKDEIKSLYNWKFDIESLVALNILDVSEIQILKNCSKNVYEKEILLKKYLSKYLNFECSSSKIPTDNFKMICNWIVRNWGGIKTGELKIDLELIDKIKTSDLPFERIASYSKIASFINPSKQIIYDSRVAYSINWILLSSTKINSDFFPIPEGRNSKLMAFDMNVLIHLILKDKFQDSIENLTDKYFINTIDTELYIYKNEAYFKLNELINLAHKKLWGEDDIELFKTEMLLFSIADHQIIKDIIQKTTITIQ